MLWEWLASTRCAYPPLADEGVLPEDFLQGLSGNSSVCCCTKIPLKQYLHMP